MRNLCIPLSLAATLVACSSTPDGSSSGSTTAGGTVGSADGSVPTDGGPPGGDSGVPGAITTLRGPSGGSRISAAMPYGMGRLGDPATITVANAAGDAVPTGSDAGRGAGCQPARRRVSVVFPTAFGSGPAHSVTSRSWRGDPRAARVTSWTIPTAAVDLNAAYAQGWGLTVGRVAAITALC